jgi:cell division protein FtsQ
MVRKKRPRRTLSRGLVIFWRLFSLAAVCAAVVIAMTVFYKVAAVEVTGVEKIDAAEIIAASGVKIGDNLFLLNKSRAEARISESFGYAEDVHIYRRLPDTIVIEVTEAVPAAHISYGDGYWLISIGGRLLEYRTATDGSSIPVSGCTLVSPRPGVSILNACDQDGGASSLVKLLSAMKDNGALDGTREIDLTKSYAVSFRYGERFNVCLGNIDNLDYKIEYMFKIISSLGPSAKGTIDLGQGSKANFVPDKTIQG